MIRLARNNTANRLSIGFYGNYNDGTAKLTGLFRDHSNGSKYKMFTTGTVDNNVVTVATLADLVVKDLTATTVTETTLVGEINGGTY